MSSMADATRAAVRTTEDTATRLTLLEDSTAALQAATAAIQASTAALQNSATALREDNAAIHGRLDSMTAILQDLSRQHQCKNLPAGTQRADSGTAEASSQLPVITDDAEPHRLPGEDYLLHRRQPPLDGPRRHFAEEFHTRHHTGDDALPRRHYGDEPYHRQQQFDDDTPRRPQFGPNRAIKIDVPRFNGENPTCWLVRVENFFDYYEISDVQKLTIASIYLDGPAISWYQSMHQRNQLTSWARFKTCLLARFGPSPFRDLRGELSKLLQTTTVQDFFDRFEHLSNQLPHIPPACLQSYFESGLRPEIQFEVRSRRPQTLEEALQLALLTEGRLAAVPAPPPPTFLRPAPPSLPPLLPTPVHPTTEPPPTQPPMVRLSPTQLAERKAKGLCFNCDERFVRGHICRATLFVILAVNDGEDTDELPQISEPIDYG